MKDCDQIAITTDRGEEEDPAEAYVRSLHDDAGSLFRFLLRLTGDHERAEEVVQETLLRAWLRAGSERGVPKPRQWLFRVARNLVIDLWRSDMKRPIVVDEDAMHTVPAKDQLERAMQRWDLAAALRRLEPHHRDVLTTIYLQDSSFADAARRLGISPGTVKSRTHYALRALRVALDAEEAL